MILHYLKVAIRNQLKYKTQTLVSLFGLAIAFVCASLAAYWNRYERTYDAFQTNADRVYRVSMTNLETGGSVSGNTPGPLHLYLKDKYPEIESSCAIVNSSINGIMVSANGKTYPTRAYPMSMTSDASDIFEIEWVEGNKTPASYKEGEIAISDQLAQTLFGDQSPLGEKLEYDRYIENEEYTADRSRYVSEYEIAGVFKSRSKHSILRMDMIAPHAVGTSWNGLSCQTYILLKQGVDHEQLIYKLQHDTVKLGFLPQVFGVVAPLTALHYTHLGNSSNVQLEDVNLFSMAAILLSLCALLNYLTLFVSRLRARGRDMALRTICGSSVWQMSGLLLTEYLLLMVGAMLVGMLFVELSMRQFMDLAMIEIEFSSVMLSCGCLMLFLVVLAVLLSAFPIFYFKRKTLRVQIESIPVRVGKNHFRSVGVCIQLVIGMLFMLCTSVMMKQVYMLLNVDNIERKQLAMIRTDDRVPDVVQNVLSQQSFIKEVLAVRPLFPPEGSSSSFINAWEGKSTDAAGFSYEAYGVNDEVARFYGLKMKEGPASFELGEKEFFVNEAMAHAMNMDRPIGKTIFKGGGVIKGVICDYHIQKPNTPPRPMLYRAVEPQKLFMAFKYEGDWQSCKRTLIKNLREKGLMKRIVLKDAEEYYRDYLKSEFNLLKLLGVITVVSILIAIFGIYALIMQSCDQHRKEIAIRKVYGAGVTDILMMFFKQYMMQVVVAVAIAFPIGYVLMKNWLEQYARQTEISIWIYLCIFLGISLLVTLCIGWRVWKAANENPAWVIKKE